MLLHLFLTALGILALVAGLHISLADEMSGAVAKVLSLIGDAVCIAGTILAIGNWFA